MIEFENVACGYAGTPVLRSISFNVEAGSAVCILGPNGIGKTTLFNTLLGFIPILEGRIMVNGVDAKGLSFSERARALSYVPQAYDYPYQFTVFETVLMGRASHIGRFAVPGEEDHEAVRRCLETLELTRFANRSFSELSGGEQQIVLTARALAQDSDFIVMDEPSSSLDYENKGKLIRAIRMLKSNGKGVLMTSHAPELAFECCESTLLLMKDGSSLFGPTEEVMSDANLSTTYGIAIKVGEATAGSGAILRGCFAEY